MANHLWQSTLFALLAGLLTLALRKNQARVRHRLWLAASVKFLVPFSLLINLGSHLARPTRPPETQPVFYFVMEEVSQPFTPARRDSRWPASAASHLLHWLPAILAALWLGGFVAVLRLWCVRWRRVAAAMRDAVPVCEGREVECASPSGKSLQECGGRLRSCCHETHWSRAFSASSAALALADRDLRTPCRMRTWRLFLPTKCSMYAGTTIWPPRCTWWWKPSSGFTRWFGGWERGWWRNASGPAMKKYCSWAMQPQVYAESILKTCEFCVESPLACVSGVTGADLKQRIVRIMTQRSANKLGFLKKLLLAAIGTGAVAAPIVAGLIKAPVATAQSTQANRDPEITFICRAPPATSRTRSRSFT